MSNYILTSELQHHGILGMKWGVRRYQNKDGSLTPLGQKRLYKTVKKYDKMKNGRMRLGGAVGKDDVITKAAREALPLAKKHAISVADRSKMESQMERYYEKISDHYGDSNKAYKAVDKKYGKEYDKLFKQADEAYREYNNGVKQIVNNYLGQYGDKKLRDISGRVFTAGEALSMQIIWGINLGAVKDDE